MLPSLMRETINPNTMNTIYDQKITLEQALDLQKKINAGQMPDMSACYRIDNRDIPVYSILDDGDLNTYNGGYYYLTRTDYATYIQGNKPLPDGYGYPSKDDPKTYEGLYCHCLTTDNSWSRHTYLFTVENWLFKWYEVAFKLTDLARVEAEPERTEINAAQVKWMLEHLTQCPKINYHNGIERIGYTVVDYDNARTTTDTYEILTTDYNSLPDEFKALADPKPFAEKYKEAFVNKPSMPAHFTYQNDEWLREANKLAVEHEELKAKYSELEKQLQEATASADAKQDKIHELEAKITKLEEDLKGQVDITMSEYYQHESLKECYSSSKQIIAGLMQANNGFKDLIINQVSYTELKNNN